MSKARAKAMTGARMTEAAPQAKSDRERAAELLVELYLEDGLVAMPPDDPPRRRQQIDRIAAVLQQARAAERERGQPLLDALRPLVTKWASSGRQTADRALVSTLFYARLRQMAPCAHRWTTWSDGTGMQESCTVCGLRRFA